MSKTENNLMEAFAGESQANRKYLAFAKQADAEGFSQIAKLFRAAAEAETVHAHAHLRAAGKIGKTADHLKQAIEGETHEFKSMYPAMIVGRRSRRAKSRFAEFRLCQRRGADPCQALSEGRRKNGGPGGGGLLCLLRLRQYRGKRTPGNLPGLRGQGQSLF